MATQRSIKMHGGVVCFTVDQLNDPDIYEFAVVPNFPPGTIINARNETLEIRKVSKDELEAALDAVR